MRSSAAKLGPPRMGKGIGLANWLGNLMAARWQPGGAGGNTHCKKWP